MGCAPAGELLLVHREQNLLLRVPVPEDLGDLPAALEDALRAYGAQRAALKKQFTPVNRHWAEASARVHRL
ncbi:hypothetical protein [Streptomyces sp. KS 21]|uniref:hypothetical protein n=1 Tax=Streptomyces sp. KS 21 TaxID=2485150 RepID=UPI001063A9E9|nr:hypothetical protein [Streptomyces sp. KS 21]TDU79997.1 hypothetical protein EDD91_6826 [Streptomyces sp. KS 21]